MEEAERFNRRLVALMLANLLLVGLQLKARAHWPSGDWSSPT